MAGLWSVRTYGLPTHRRGVPPLCGRAPVRALFSGHRGSGSMDRAWVGPLYWIQWAGGFRHLHPRGWRNGPGGELRSPDCALPMRCAEPVRSVREPVPAPPSWPEIDPASPGQLPLLPWKLTARRASWGSVSGAHSRRRRRALYGRSPLHRHVYGGAFDGAQAAPPPLRCASFMAAWGTGSYGALVVHSLWRRPCGGWWGGAAPQREQS